jgi:hypothetical protein
MGGPGSFDLLTSLAEDEGAFSMSALLGAANNPWDAAEAAALQTHDTSMGLAEDGEADDEPAEHGGGEDQEVEAAEPGHDAIKAELDGIDTAEEKDQEVEAAEPAGDAMKLDLEVVDTAEEEDQEVEAAEPAANAMQTELPVTDTVGEEESPEVYSVEPAAGDEGQLDFEFVDLTDIPDEEPEGEASDTEAECEEDHHPWSVKPAHWGRSHDLDWHEKRRLMHEQACAILYKTPWQERGPTPKAGAERPGFWRGQAYRAGTNRWANRGGRNKDYYSWLAKNTDWKGGKSGNKGGKPNCGGGKKGGSGDGSKGGKASGSGGGKGSGSGGGKASGYGDHGMSSGSGDPYPASDLDLRPKWGKGPSGGKGSGGKGPSGGT